MHNLQSTLPAGHVLRGQYGVIDVLGQGAFGAVYLVKDERNPQKQFTLKEVMHADREERSSFSFDAAALKRLYHPALPDIYQVFSGDDNDLFYILMDYVEGSNLEDVRRLMPGKRFSLHTALTLMSPIMDAISYLHRQHPHLVHGDVKPSNIIASLAGKDTPTKLVDFGGVNTLYTDTPAEQSMLNYRAPEQFGRRASRRTDVYGLGATFYTLLSGTVPVSASDRLARIDEGKPDPLSPVNQINPFVQPVVAETITCAMSLSRHDRYASVEQFREALWQVMHANVMELQTPDFSAMLQAGEQTKSDPGPDSATLESEVPALIAYALMQEEMTFAGVPSGPLLAPTTAGKAKPPVMESSEDRPFVVRRKKRRVPSSSGTHGTDRRRKHKKRAFFRLGLVFLLVCVIGSGVAIAGYQIYNAKYQSETALAQVGIKHLQTAVSFVQAWPKNPLDTASVTRARQEFAAASTVFTQLDTDLQSYAGIGTLIPGSSTRLNAALHVIPVAMEISRAGIAGCAALNLIISRFHEPFGTGNGITSTDLAEIRTNFQQVETDIKLAIDQVNALQPGDLQFDARIGKAVALFHQYLPTVQAFLQQADQLLPILPSLLGINAPAYYLVEILDSTELRPGGGFIKDYGFATLLGGRMSAAHISDTNLLDNQFSGTGQTIPYPPAYRWFDLTSTSHGWNLSDSNLDADFPTAARYAEQNYKLENGKVQIQGVIAITTALMQRALAITGPISVPEFHQTVTAQNLIELIQYYQLGPGSHGASIISPGSNAHASRYFTELLAQDFLARIHQTRASVVPKLIQMLVSSLRTKDLQIAFDASSPAEKLLHLSRKDAAINAPTGDSFFVVDANTAADTANQYITNTLDDQVTIDDSGNATHHTTIHYAWLKNGKVFGSSVYSDYVRVYVPPGSSLREQEGWQQAASSEAFGREVWAGSFTLSYGQTNTVILTWTEKGVAKKDAAGWHYQYLIQRQAGVSWTLNLQITLPACAVKTRTSGGLVSRTGQITTLTKSLTEDTNLGIDYSC